MVTMNVSLPDEMKAYAEERAASGEYAGTSDYVRDLIRRDQRYRRGLARLQELVDEARESGPVEEWSRDDLFEHVTGRKQLVDVSV